MYEFSETSKSKLATCDKRIQLICNEAIKVFDFSVLCGHRGKVAQNAAYDADKSDKQWPDGRHNPEPSEAVDVAPYPVIWPDRSTIVNTLVRSSYTDELVCKQLVNVVMSRVDEYMKQLARFYELAGVLLTIANQHDISLIWGGRWEYRKDYGHFELKVNG